MFHKHETITDDKLKTRLKEKLDSDEYCANQLRKLQDNGYSYDELWDEKQYMVIYIAQVSQMIRHRTYILR